MHAQREGGGMLRIGNYHLAGPVSMLRRLRAPRPVEGQITHYEPGAGVGSWTITSDEVGKRQRLRRALAELMRGEPRVQSVTLPVAAPEPRSDR